jgi:hypothetical protein
MVEQGPTATFHSLEVPQQGVSSDTLLRPLQGMECNNTSPITIWLYANIQLLHNERTTTTQLLYNCHTSIIQLVVWYRKFITLSWTLR